MSEPTENKLPHLIVVGRRLVKVASDAEAHNVFEQLYGNGTGGIDTGKPEAAAAVARAKMVLNQIQNGAIEPIDPATGKPLAPDEVVIDTTEPEPAGEPPVPLAPPIVPHGGRGYGGRKFRGANAQMARDALGSAPIRREGKHKGGHHPKKPRNE